MGYHTFDADRADELEQAAKRYRFCSAEELTWALGPSAGDVVADLGSGTGFYTDDIAPHVSTLFAVDIQPAMHDYYREKGVPETVELVTSGVETLPFDDGQLNGAFSTMTFHEFATEEALGEVARVLAEDGTLVIVDWSASGRGDHGPPPAERYHADEAADALREAGFGITHQADRPETFLLQATLETE